MVVDYEFFPDGGGEPEEGTVTTSTRIRVREGTQETSVIIDPERRRIFSGPQRQDLVAGKPVTVWASSRRIPGEIIELLGKVRATLRNNL
jgi:hypothetical protein